jgi:lipopolysaccharide biosynthesis protein
MIKAESIVLKQELDFTRDVCLFVTHSIDCTTKPYVAHHVKALLKAGYQVVMIYNAEKMSLARRVNGFALPNGLVVRQNVGFDFGAWADALRLFPALWGCPRVLLVNDSVIGPVNGGVTMFERVRTIAGDVVGLTESHQIIRHFQSYFLLMNRRALDNACVREFWDTVENLDSKNEVIRSYELTFTELCKRSGLETRAIFPRSPSGNDPSKENPTIFHWRELARLGFPYIKIALVRDWLSHKGLVELKALIADPALAPFIDTYASLRVRSQN